MLATTAIVVGAVTFIVAFAMSLDDDREGFGYSIAMLIGAGLIAGGIIGALAP